MSILDDDSWYHIYDLDGERIESVTYMKPRQHWPDNGNPICGDAIINSIRDMADRLGTSCPDCKSHPEYIRHALAEASKCVSTDYTPQ